MLRSLIGFAALTLLLAGAALAEDGPVADKSRVCMVQDTVMDKPGIRVEHAGRTYYGCCAMCSQMIANEPERYTRSRDPLSGAEVDKADAPVLALRGRALYFENERNLERFRRQYEAQSPPR